VALSRGKGELVTLQTQAGRSETVHRKSQAGPLRPVSLRGGKAPGEKSKTSLIGIKHWPGLLKVRLEKTFKTGPRRESTLRKGQEQNGRPGRIEPKDPGNPLAKLYIGGENKVSVTIV